MINQQTKKLLLAASVLLSLFFFIFIVNQAFQFSENLGTIHPFLAEITFWVFLTLAVACLLLPAYLFFGLPKRLTPPKTEGPEFDQYLKKLSKRLNNNRLLTSHKIQAREDIESALVKLDELADKQIQRSGHRAFYSTAISQNGSLDAIAILGIQMKLIWDVAHIYLQRPTLRDFAFLYSNVFATAFIASQLDEAEYLEAVEPVISTVLGSAVTAVPGTSVFVNSIISGSSNTFLTLRVGLITKEYCNSLTRPSKTAVRKRATYEAGKMLVSISKEGTLVLSRKLKNTFGEKFTGAFSDLNEKIKNTGSSFSEKYSFFGSKKE